MFFGKGKLVVDVVREHLDAVYRCYDAYDTAMNAIFGGCSRDEKERYNAQLRQLETEADQLRHQIIKRMLDGGLLVDSRKSLMHIIENTDRVADLAEDIIGMFYQEQIEIYEFMKEPVNEMNRITGEQLKLLADAISQIIYKYNIDDLFDLIREIETLESKVDDIENGLLITLFDMPFDLSVKLQLKHIINKISSISDLIEDVSDLIEIVMLSRKV